MLARMPAFGDEWIASQIAAFMSMMRGKPVDLEVARRALKD
jgi:hypothetical protein